MFWVAMLGAALIIVVLAWCCRLAAEEVNEAAEELNDRIRQLQAVVGRVSRTGGYGARVIRERGRPLREILRNIEVTRPHRG